MAQANANRPDHLTIEGNDRILILAPHPDDEAIACGGVIQRAIAARAAVRVVFLTYGDSNEISFLLHKKHPVLRPSSVRRMGLIRRTEALCAADRLGLKRCALEFLGYPDFGMLHIWQQHWGRCPPFRSILTKADRVPYGTAYRAGAAYRADDILKDITSIIQEHEPTKIFVSHPADQNSDHRALYLFTMVALWNLALEPVPAIYPYLVHYRKWPAKKGFRPNEPLLPPDLLSERIEWTQMELPAAEVAGKRAAIRAHSTQCRYSARFLLSFARRCELFGDFPMVSLAPPKKTQAVGESIATSAGSNAPMNGLEERRSRLTGREWQSAAWDGKTLVISVWLSRPIAGAVSISLYVFGYRPDRAFGRMPKLHIRVHPLKHDVFVQTRKLPETRVTISRSNREIAVSIPGSLMSDPRRVMVSMRTYLADMPLDSAEWRIIDLDSSVEPTREAGLVTPRRCLK